MTEQLTAADVDRLKAELAICRALTAEDDRQRARVRSRNDAIAALTAGLLISLAINGILIARAL